MAGGEDPGKHSVYSRHGLSCRKWGNLFRVTLENFIGYLVGLVCLLCCFHNKTQNTIILWLHKEHRWKSGEGETNAVIVRWDRQGRKVSSSWNMVSPYAILTELQEWWRCWRDNCPHMVTAPLWRGEPATEQEAIGFVVPDEEKEGVVSTELWNI